MELLTYNRNGLISPNPIYEKSVILPSAGETDPSIIGWADARFAIDIMAEHALFFVLLMPPEVAGPERDEAQRFYGTFSGILQQIDSNPPPPANELKTFAKTLVDQIKPFIDYKDRMEFAQTSGKLRSLVWPLFFNHTKREAVRWSNRLNQIAMGEPEFDKSEVSLFWTEIMDDHAQFMAHLLDPVEKHLITVAFNTSHTFDNLHQDCLVASPKDTDNILVAAESILDFKTKAVRGIEAGVIKSIIDPRLADHVRREAVKFIDELKRAV